jgi:hypothetical protein
MASAESGDEVHLFYRENPNQEFIYSGKLQLVSCDRGDLDSARYVALAGGSCNLFFVKFVDVLNVTDCFCQRSERTLDRIGC